MTKVLSSRVVGPATSTPSEEGNNVTVTEDAGVIVSAAVEVEAPESRTGKTHGHGQERVIFGRALTDGDTERAKHVTLSEFSRLNLPENERSDITAMLFGV